MAKTGKKRQKIQMPAGIRNKLMAAVSMLMVSSIMLVSSSYAWFTLSTAPEITGITTNVGANGNLEMMLLNNTSYNSTQDDLGVISEVGDSMAVKNVKDANEKWGNLVDLGAIDATTNANAYGLHKITLMPSKLNVSSGIIQSNPLLTPSYGSDGRVIKVDTAAFTGAFANGAWNYNEDAAGVRALGTIAGTTLQVSTYRSALVEMNSAINSAVTTARRSLEGGVAQSLASLMIDKALDVNEFDRAYLDDIENIVSKTKEANGYIDKAIRNAVLAYNLSGAFKDTKLNDEDVANIETAIMSATLAELKVGVKITLTSENAEKFTVSLPDKISEAIEKYNDTEAKLKVAETELNKLTNSYSGKIPWNDTNNVGILSVLTPLVNPNLMTVDGYNISDVDGLKSHLISKMLGIGQEDKTIIIEMQAESGVYYNIAQVCGQFSVNGNVQIDIDTLKAKFDIIPSEMTGIMEIPFTMTPKTSDNYMKTASTVIDNAGAPEVETGEGTTVSLETYGYMLDFGFRTNADQANLQLQTEGIQRVYNSDEDGNAKSTATGTMGAGSYMKFKTLDTNIFSLNEMRALMSAIRLVFVQPDIDTDTYTIKAVASPVITKAESATTPGLFEYSGGTVSTTDAADDTLEVPLKLYSYMIDDTTKKLTIGDLLKDESGNEASKIVELTQNKASKVSVIVYLDGDIVDNTMVANATSSMVGSINLQFSTNADLKPMYNTGLFKGEIGVDGTVTEETYTAVVTGPKEYTQSIGDTSYTVNVKEGYTIYQKGDNYYYSNDATTYTQITSWAANCDAFTVTVNP